MKRRDFLKTSLAASALAGLGPAGVQPAAAQPAGGAAQEYYEIRAYRFKEGASHELLDGYLEKAAIPALNRLGLKPIGVFTELEPQGAARSMCSFPILPSIFCDRSATPERRRGLHAGRGRRPAGAEIQPCVRAD